MASVYGMSDFAGLMVLEKRQSGFLGGGMSSKDYSDNMSQKLDEFIMGTLTDRYNEVKKILTDNKDAIEEMTQELLDIEVITGERVREIIKANGGKVFEEEDLHTEALTKEESNKEDNKE